MIVYIKVDEENRVQGWGSTRGSSTDIKIIVPEDHEILKVPVIYKYIEGKLVRDDAYQQRLISEIESGKNKPKTPIESELLELKLALADLAEVVLGGK